MLGEYTNRPYWLFLNSSFVGKFTVAYINRLSANGEGVGKLSAGALSSVYPALGSALSTRKKKNQ